MLYFIASRTKDTESHTGNCKFSEQKVCGFVYVFFVFSVSKLASKLCRKHAIVINFLCSLCEEFRAAKKAIDILRLIPQTLYCNALSVITKRTEELRWLKSFFKLLPPSLCWVPSAKLL